MKLLYFPLETVKLIKWTFRNTGDRQWISVATREPVDWYSHKLNRCPNIWIEFPIDRHVTYSNTLKWCITYWQLVYNKLFTMIVKHNGFLKGLSTAVFFLLSKQKIIAIGLNSNLWYSLCLKWFIPATGNSNEVF